MWEKIPETINFSKEEEKILILWKELDVFQTCLKHSKGKPKYSFYDGPPFATGLPHYGHILAGTIKDIVTRYAHQSGLHVERRFGWDTHGLPVEFEIDRALNIKGPKDVAKMGIATYNAECRKIVMRYAEEWERIVSRIGRWIDFKDDYKTLYPWYMESIWWIFKELYNKGLIYQGVKVMPFSTGCNTPISNFESGQNYKDVIDPSVVVSFPLLDEPNTFLLAWTTTPWTLTSNLALCCNPNFEYVEIKDNSTGNIYILLESSLSLIYKSSDLYTILRKRNGYEFKGKSYEPLFPYFKRLKEKGAFVVLNDNYVTAENGTGIVHQAPYFGEDDYRCCINAGVITKDQEIVCPIDSRGYFVEPVYDFLDTYVKDADKAIIKYLQTRKRLVYNGSIKHSYPYCWRSDSPLIYKAVPSWFVRVESIKENLLKANSETYWVPEYVKEKRFGNWLKDARDWAISRNRYWGNPIPLWISEDGKEIVCVGSIAELKELTGCNIRDIHRENIDHLTIPSNRPNQPPLRRVQEVFDCWFESGSMPYAQKHFPFKCKTDFLESFPADFIAEGIDQTRGWFYTLSVISTALFDKAPFRNLIANGLILASDGQKMSKRKKNYPDPMEIVDKYGADALRLYLINSPVVRAENLRFKEEGVKDIIKDVFLPWYNAFRFLLLNIQKFEIEYKVPFIFHEQTTSPTNIMDNWILSFTQTLLRFLKHEMKAYRLYTVVPCLIKFIDNLTNWYVRMNRKRIKGECGQKDCESALNTLFSVIYTMVLVNAPFTPFLTEFMFQQLSKLVSPSKNNMESVHYQIIPDSRQELINEKIENAISHLQTIIEVGRILRDRKNIPIKYPLPEIIVIHQDEKVLKEIMSVKEYILQELNVKELILTTDKEKYGVKLKAVPDHKILGTRLKGEFKLVSEAINELSDQQLQDFDILKEITVNGHKIYEGDLKIKFIFTGNTAEKLSEQYEAHSEKNILLLLNVTPDESMQNEGIAREIINRIQKLRKKAQLIQSDEAIIYYDIKDKSSNLNNIIVSYKDFIENTTKTPQKNIIDLPENSKVLIEDLQKIKGSDIQFILVKSDVSESVQTFNSISNNQLSSNKYVNVQLVGMAPRYGATSNVGKILLETKDSFDHITYKLLQKEIETIFGIYGISFNLHYKDIQITAATDIFNLHGETIYVTKSK
ncbi:isoleucine--tRNA ligase, cytoplasmic [Prorops nasuta]|uniref:isoleucine--tRNA ligase, cytoplasmic n=1 Tax=Prorops nasuta TaxID=863751 RepID=UPI0034CF4C3B